MQVIILMCVESESGSAIPATISQQSSNNVQVQLKDETKPTEAAKLSTEFVAEVGIFGDSWDVQLVHCLCGIYYLEMG